MAYLNRLDNGVVTTEHPPFERTVRANRANNELRFRRYDGIELPQGATVNVNTRNLSQSTLSYLGNTYKGGDSLVMFFENDSVSISVMRLIASAVGEWTYQRNHYEKRDKKSALARQASEDYLAYYA